MDGIKITVAMAIQANMIDFIGIQEDRGGRTKANKYEGSKCSNDFQTGSRIWLNCFTGVAVMA